MGFLFVFALLFLLVFLFMENTRTRLVALGVLTFFAIVGTVYFVYLDVGEDGPEPPAADARLEDTRELARRTALVRQAIRPEDIAFAERSFAPSTQQVLNSRGQPEERPDLFSWVFSGTLQNRNSEYTVRDAVFRLRLFACPEFVSGDLALEELKVRCNTIGDRRLALYNLGIAPGGTAAFHEPVTFDNQPDPGNWRYWVETVSVSARID